MRPVIQIGLLTACFAGGYFALRSIPASNCNFLHYEQTITTADGLQFCGSGAAYFVDLEKLPFPVTVTLTPDHPPAPGVESHYTLTLQIANGEILRPSQLAESQTRKLHLLLVDPNLEDYQHIHPEPVGDSGQWAFAFTPHGAGTYRVYAQFIPLLSMREMIGEAKIPVSGAATPAVHRGLAPFQDDGYVYTLTTPASPVPLGLDATLTLTIRRADGGKVTLQPIMGTLAHLVAFDPARDGLAHLHPTLTNHETDALQPSLAFQINFTQPGHYRVWGQVKINDRERYVPFDLDVTGKN
jgi:hypothetical protein